jgi:hypothetical protein
MESGGDRACGAAALANAATPTPERLMDPAM